jgi:hypothetical protein
MTKMDVPELLEAASLLVPGEVATNNDITVADVWDYLIHDEWEVALDILEDLGDGHPLPLTFWETLADAAERLRMERSAAWCHWRCYEATNGVIRADLTLRPTDQTRRGTPLPGAGVLPADVGRRTPLTHRRAGTQHRRTVGGEQTLPGPGGRSTVRLAPLVPHQWQHLQPGQQITLHEGQPVTGTAVILEVRRPTTAPPPA